LAAKDYKSPKKERALSTVQSHGELPYPNPFNGAFEMDISAIQKNIDETFVPDHTAMASFIGDQTCYDLDQ